MTTPQTPPGTHALARALRQARSQTVALVGQLSLWRKAHDLPAVRWTLGPP